MPYVLSRDQKYFGEMEFAPTRSPNIHMFLPSGTKIIGIDSWVEKFAKLYMNTPM